MVLRTYFPIYLSGWGKTIIWAQVFKIQCGQHGKFPAQKVQQNKQQNPTDLKMGKVEI